MNLCMVAYSCFFWVSIRHINTITLSIVCNLRHILLFSPYVELVLITCREADYFIKDAESLVVSGRVVLLDSLIEENLNLYPTLVVRKAKKNDQRVFFIYVSLSNVFSNKNHSYNKYFFGKQLHLILI